MFQIKKRNIDIRANWQIFWRRKLFFIISFILSFIIGLVYCVITKPVYQSSTVVRVSHSQLISGAIQRLVPGITARERNTNLNRLITSHAYLKRLSATLNLINDPKMRARAEVNKALYPDLTIDEITELLWIKRLKQLFTIRQLGTDFIQINALGNTPEMVFNFARALTQIFIDESLRREVGGIRGALEFSSEQLAIYKKKLEESEEQLKRYKEGIVRDDFENNSIVSANLDQVNSKLAATDFELREAKDRLHFLKSQLNELNIYYKAPNNKSLNRLKAQLLEAILQLSKLMLKYSWQDVKILKINSQIENLRINIRKEIEAELKSKYRISNGSNLNIIVQQEITSMDVDFLERKKKALSNLINIYKSSISKGPSQEMTLSRLQRQVEANREIYQALLQQTRGSEIEEALQRTAAEFKFKIIEPAIKPLAPIKPNRNKIMMMAILVGSIVGFALIFILEYMDYSFKNIEDVEKYLNLPVLGTIPKIDKQTTNIF